MKQISAYILLLFTKCPAGQNLKYKLNNKKNIFYMFNRVRENTNLHKYPQSAV